MKIAIQMDSFAALASKGDSTLALINEAHARGFELFHYVPKNLSMRANNIFAYGADIKEINNGNYILGEQRQVVLNNFNVVLMRQDPPFDMSYITATYLLEQLPSDVLVINNAAQVRNSPEKIFVMEYPQLMPATLITSSGEDVRNFANEFSNIIIKPLYGNGGEGVFKVGQKDENFHSIIETFLAKEQAFIVQQYLPSVKNGDRRVILLDGKPVGAINRVPKQGEVRSNMHVGGIAKPHQLNDIERGICLAIGGELKNRGLFFVGIDIIGEKLTEINVTSPTGIVEIKQLCNIDIAKIFWDKILAKKTC